MYFYAVATMVGEQESARTEWQSVLIPPNKESVPILKIVNNENDNITLRYAEISRWLRDKVSNSFS